MAEADSPAVGGSEMRIAAGLPAASGWFDPFAGITQIRFGGRPGPSGASQPGRLRTSQIPSSRMVRMYFVG